MATGSVRELWASQERDGATAGLGRGGCGGTSPASLLSPDLIQQKTRASLTPKAVVRLNVSDLRDAEG